MRAACRFVTVLVIAAPWCPGQEPAPDAGPELMFARVVAPEVQPRCFASMRSPVFDEKLVEGQIVKVGKQVGEFRRLYLPFGVRGWVHKKYTSVPENGALQTTGRVVAFRYRPQSREAPAMELGKGTKLLYLAEQGDWWNVMCADVPTFVAAADVQELDADAPAVAASWAELEKLRRQGWMDASAALQRVAAERDALQKHREKLAEITQRFGAIAPADADQTALEALLGEVKPLVEAFADDPTQLSLAKSLAEQIDKQILLAKAKAALRTEPPRENVADKIVAPRPKDRLGAYAGIGWLRYEGGDAGEPGHGILHKGGHNLFLVTCTTGRYDLRMFDGLEIGIAGEPRVLDDEAVRTLDAERIVVLGPRR